ncbi:transposase [Candidimonas sp. SYP-B2681]|uniref:transposase n=1 Tax=Candidimonas sp. SYP-B2681 TaxID=2497686 RepID=UPI001315898C|nr:transposase [Candidimonas sp. SYP-B2681]
MERAEIEGRRRRRNYTAQFKDEVIECCEQLGVSIAAVARAYDLHPNLLRRWVAEHERGGRHTLPGPVSEPALQVGAPNHGGAFIPITMPQRVAVEPVKKGCINIELSSGNLVARVSWPIHASAECASWLRQLMK